MAKNKHLLYDERLTIESMLKKQASFKQIAAELEKDPCTISREIRARLVFEKTGARHKNYNSCVYRYSCTKVSVCTQCKSDVHYTYCRNCFACNKFCPDFKPYVCPKLQHPPYVCNGCSDRTSCCLEKRVYRAKEAHYDYRAVLSEVRSGTSSSEDEVMFLDNLITPLVEQHQSPHHIYITHKDELNICERTIYRMIDSRIISAKNIDLPRKVRFRSRKKTVFMKVDRACRIDRTYVDYITYKADHPDFPVVELDSVEGKIGGPVLLTIHFVKSEMMLAFIRAHNDSKSVSEIFNRLHTTLGVDCYKSLFRICLADRGSEFSNPSAIEFGSDSDREVRLFYCDPQCPQQKGSAERNHEFIRYFIPKGTDLNIYTQDDISLMMDHINSYSRESLGNKSPYEVFAFMYGENVLTSLNCNKILPQNVTLGKAVFKRGNGNV